MNLLAFLKYPPTQGGESTKAYWLMKGLSSRGHKIHVVSNCMETEQDYRVKLNGQDLERLQDENIELYSSDSLHTPSFIPQFNPMTDKLVSRGLEITESENIDLILGWYLVPNGLAAAYTSSLTGIPYILQHAGSDMKRLLPDPYLKRVLTKAIENADGILHYAKEKRTFELIGVDEEKMFQHNPAIPEDYAEQAEVKIQDYILSLGKITEAKGSVDLLLAYKESAIPEKLLYVGNGSIRDDMATLASKMKLERVVFADPVPPWRVPSLLRNATATFCGEREDFNVPNHQSRIPLEAIVCGSPLLMSSYVKDKGIYRNLTGQDTYTFEPGNIKQISQRLIQISGHKHEAIKKAESAKQRITPSLPSFDEYLKEIEGALEKACRK